MPTGSADPKRRRRRLLVGAQVALLVVAVVFAALSLRGSLDDVGPRLRSLEPWPIALAAVALAVYYLVFVVGWMLVLRAFGMAIDYPSAVGAEMLSMLAKYVPGGVWTPAARIVACQRLGLAPGPVLASIGYEAGLSAISGVLVLLVALPITPDVDSPVPLWLLAAFAGVLLIALHPRIYGPVADRLLGRLGTEAIPRLGVGDAARILAFYAITWPIGGVVLWFLTRAVGADVPLAAIPYLGGASAVGAIVAVLVVFAPSGLGVREGAVFALLLAYLDRTDALLVVAVNRILITVIEALLLAVVTLLRRRRPSPATRAG